VSAARLHSSADSTQLMPVALLSMLLLLLRDGRLSTPVTLPWFHLGKKNNLLL